MSQVYNNSSNDRQHGFTLVELMVAMVLGLVVIGGVISVFLSNQQSYRTNQALGEVQDNSRTTFEFMARDIRDAGLTGCGNFGRVANVLNNSPSCTGSTCTTSAWWANFNSAVIGYDGATTDPAVATGTAVAARVAGTDSIQVLGADGSGFTIASHVPSSATIHLTQSAAGVIVPGDVVIICSPDHAAITQITGPTTITNTLVHNTGTGTPGNCSKVLNFPTVCSANPSSGIAFPPNSQIAKLSASDWYIGNHNTTGGRSLYRISVVGGAQTPQEMVRNVTDMQITYLVNGTATFVPASSVTAANWANVTAVQLRLTLQSTNQRAGTDVQPLTRFYTTTITLRNRVK